MNRFRIYFLFLPISIGFLIISGCKKSGDSSGPMNSFKRYPYKQLHLSYTYAADLRGTEDFYIADYGKYEARYSDFEILAPDENPKQITGSITKGTEIYDLDYKKKIFGHIFSHSLDSIYHLSEEDIPSPDKYLASEMKVHLLSNKGVDMILGKPATRWQDEGGTTLWIWNTILLRKRIINVKGVMEMNINSIDSLWNVDTTKFMVPPGFIDTPRTP